MRIIGPIVGALIAALITLETSNPYLLLALLFSFAVVVFATMRVNLIFTQIFLVPFRRGYEIWKHGGKMDTNSGSKHSSKKKR